MPQSPRSWCPTPTLRLWASRFGSSWVTQTCTWPTHCQSPRSFQWCLGLWRCDNLRPCSHAATASQLHQVPVRSIYPFPPIHASTFGLNGRHWANLRLGRLSRSGYLIARLSVAPKAPIPKGWPQLILSRFHRSCGTLVVGNGVAVEQPQADELNWWSK